MNLLFRVAVLFVILLNAIHIFPQNYPLGSETSSLKSSKDSSWFSEHETLNGALFYSTIYGDFIVEEPLIIEIIKSPEMQRLKNINQYGIDYYVYKPEIYTRFQHSIAVYLLTRHYGASLLEQVAALLHDVSHTIFSHTGDFLLKDDLRVDSYQDDIHDYFLQHSSIKAILEKYNIATNQISPKNAEFIILDQPSPNVCTDRIEYNLYGGYVEGILTPQKIKVILSYLKFENGLWYFEDLAAAKVLGYTALYLTDTRFAGHDNFARNFLFRRILERALEIDLITIEDIHSSTDEIAWKKLTDCTDSAISTMLGKLTTISKFYEVNILKHDFYAYPKFRALNPLVKTPKGLVALTEVCSEFKKDFEVLRDRIAQGIPLKFKD